MKKLIEALKRFNITLKNKIQTKESPHTSDEHDAYHKQLSKENYISNATLPGICKKINSTPVDNKQNIKRPEK